MPNSHLNAPQLGTSASYARSQDFLNIDEPPSAQETPSVSTFNLPGPTTPAPTAEKPTPMLRRRSTNYMDALSSRAQARERESSIGEHAPIPIPAPVSESSSGAVSAAERRGSGPMDFQNTIHNLQYQTTNDSDMSHAGVDMGDFISHTPASSGTSDQPIFKSSFLNNGSGNNTRIPRDAALQPDPPRRKSSFKYEDFKKDIYNKLHMFEDK
ncbi:hypothetical protein SEUBUCD646_0F00780 [Saccharomyces eubayanus]|uniref:IGD1-like protein n=1 Tax=Saccharomyces eubayanus TaxID=1080349 RepID=A0ABN8VP22_SACEU|nr:hypothetical protein SEUBUCD650_0F00760 [Saccharomyces eubayanus]CAI2001190.1 hypothetical protein SEUBUCD646_0F00780 [Saccharomyces eubayanus]